VIALATQVRHRVLPLLGALAVSRGTA
jgi:hypothetical protein